MQANWAHTHPIARSRRSLQCHASSKPVKVTFQVPYRVQFGQCLGVVGSCDLLGQWDGNKAVRMSWSPGDVWVAEIEVHPGQQGKQIEYKYVVINSDGRVGTWKPGKNSQLQVEPCLKIHVSESWDDSGPRKVEVEQDSQQQQQQRQQQENSPSQPQEKQQHYTNVMPSFMQHRSGLSVLQQEAQAAMSDLQDALNRQVAALETGADPAALDIILGDRLLAAASSKAVALTRALRATEVLPVLPPKKP